jgi:hypothetical protein
MNNIQLSEFFSRRPEMLKVFNRQDTYADFAGNIAESVAPGNVGNRLNKVIIEEANRILSGLIPLDSLEHQLSEVPLISYADHMGLLNSNLLYNANILYAEIVKRLKLDISVVFATGNVPLKNQSYPRGFYFKKTKFSFFKNRLRHTPVYLLKEKINASRNEGISSFILNSDSNILTPEEKKFLDFLFFEALQIERASENFETFSDQITFLNHRLWKYYFDESIRASVPRLLYLQSNQIVLKLLLEQLNDSDSLLSSILFEPAVRRLYLKNFHGIPCCWGDNMGSRFFWGITEKQKYISLQVDETGNCLVGPGITIRLERNSLIEALTAKKLLPTIFLDFLLITFQEGFQAPGGFNQLEFLARMKSAHVHCLEELGMFDTAKSFRSRNTGGLICGMFPFDFHSGIDLLWHFNSRDGKFNGNLERGLTGEHLDRMLNSNLKAMILPAIGTMLDNM